MNREPQQQKIKYCDDNELAYEKYRTQFVNGQGRVFDDAYRLAHLPLVAPDHPRVIPTKPGSGYHRGLHDLIYSIALPIKAEDLLASENFIKLQEEIKATSFAHKISWETFAQRKNKLHATVCGSISIGQMPHVDERTYNELRSIGSVGISIRGVFSGNINIGRLYLKLYPELRNGKNMCHEIQRIFGAPLTNLYVVGLWNFTEELDVDEAQALNSLLKLWWDIDLIQLRLESLWLLKSRDDLVLDGAVDQIIPLA